MTEDLLTISVFHLIILSGNMKKLLYIIIPLILASIVTAIFIFSSRRDSSDISYWNAFTNNNKIFSPPIPDSVDFAGEAVPLDLFYVREALDRELTVNTYFHSSTLFMFKRAHRWLPVIDSILRKNGVPEDFKYVAMIESGLRNVVSPTGATGYWQFVNNTGKEYGLEINDEVDERYHVERSTEAACQYFNDTYAVFHSWTLAAVSYNGGKNLVSDAMERQGVSSFYDLLLNEETTRYIYRILALKIIYNHPTQYGYFLREKDFYPTVPNRTVIVDTSINNLAQFARDHDINYLVLKEFNPWLRQNYLHNRQRKTYMIKIPVKGYLNYSKLLKRHHQDDENIFGDTLKVKDLM